MNNTFNLTRFGQLLKKDLFENWKKYTLQTLTLFSIILVSFMLQSLGKYDINNLDYMVSYGYKSINDSLIAITVIIFTISYAIFLSQMMDSLRSKQKRTHYLTFPCSSLEKYLSKFIIHVTGFVFVFLVAVYLADLLRVLIYSIPATNIEVKSLRLFSELIKDVGDKEPQILVMSLYLFMMSFYALGSTFWQRNGFIKSTVAIASILLLGGFIIFSLAKVLYTPGMYFNTFNLDRDELSILFNLAVGVILTGTVFIYVLSYYRFKEAELIERW